MIRRLTQAALPTLALLTLALPTLAAEQKIPKQLQKLLAMTPAEFQSRTTLKDDAMETSAVVTTVNGFQEKQGLLGFVNSDVFLRAIVDKKTKTVVYQVYALMRYGGSWRFYETVNYETADGLQSSDLTKVSSDVESCGQVTGCIYNEQVGFTVDEALLRKIAAHYVPGALAAWKFRFKSKAGADWNEYMVAAEVAGLLAAVDAYKASH